MEDENLSNCSEKMLDDMKHPTQELTIVTTTEELNSYLLVESNRFAKLDYTEVTKSPASSRKKKAASDQVAFEDDPRAEELQHASDMMSASDDMDGDIHALSNENSRSTGRGSNASSIRVEIQDLGNDGSYNFTTSTLRKCKKLVLRPYWGLLVFIGWRGFHKESIYAQRLRWKILNVAYPSIIILLLLYTYMYEILACEWKLNIVASQIPTPTPTPASTPKPNDTNVTGISIDSSGTKHPVIKINMTDLQNSHSHNLGCDHIITTYLIPNLLHLLAYVMGLYYFRIQENEQLYALMEKVFLQATPVQARTASQQKMIHRLRIFLVVGSLWVLSTVVLQCLYMWAYNIPKLPLFHTMGATGYWLLFGIELLGRTVFNSVILAIVMNYATQCEMVKFYIRGLGMRLQEKSTDLKTAMKDVLMLRQSLSLLNGIISKMTSLAAVILGELSIIGICILFLNEQDDPIVWVYRALFPIIWAVMLSFPLFQAARVNSICLRIQKISLEMRVFGYKGASILDLDSFLQFVTLTKLKAKLFHIPILPSYLIFSAIVTAFVLLILVQTSSIGPADYIF